jgi:hypothetical protein
MYGANIVFKEAGLQDLQKLAENYVRSGTSRRLLAFGLDEPAFIDALTAQLSSKLLEKLSGTVGDIWLVGGSATLVKILYKIYPDRKFHLVQVGKTIWPDQINANTQLYVANRRRLCRRITQSQHMMPNCGGLCLKGPNPATLFGTSRANVWLISDDIST